MGTGCIHPVNIMFQIDSISINFKINLLQKCLMYRMNTMYSVCRMAYDMVTQHLTSTFRTNVTIYRMTFRTIHNGIHNIQDIKKHCGDIDMSITGHTHVNNRAYTNYNRAFTKITIFNTTCSGCVFHPVPTFHILYIVPRILYTLYIVLL